MLVPFVSFSQNQIYFSENWNQDGGEVPLFYKNASATDDIGNVYMVGSTINTNNNHDIIIQKFDVDGGLLWQQIFNGAANMDDMAADIYVDANYNVYVTGTSVEHINQDDDFKFAYSVYTKDTSYHLNVDENNLTSDEVTVFPNPTNDVINVLFSNKAHDFSIYDIMGRKIQNFNIENSSDKSLKVDVSTLPKGMYLFIFNKGESRITKKIIKQ